MNSIKRISLTAASKLCLNESKIYDEEERIVGKVQDHTTKSPHQSTNAQEYLEHDCDSKCNPGIKLNLDKYSPLAKPLLYHWDRLVIVEDNLRKVVYKTPCGRTLWNLDQVQQMLDICDFDNLQIDFFSFDLDIHPLRLYVGDFTKCAFYKADYTDRQEAIEIPVINVFENYGPPEIKYTTKRVLSKGMKVNFDPKFLCSCTCKDNCKNKSKCECQLLTNSGISVQEEEGYRHKRLCNIVLSGIFECNQNCQCNKSCNNRVVQQPIQVLLQIFRTKNRGFAVRSLCDIPRGTFVCNYTGKIHSDEEINELCDKNNNQLNDKYFIELDFIEKYEKFKEGYESDVKLKSEDLEDMELDESSDSSLDEEFWERIIKNRANAGLKLCQSTSLNEDESEQKPSATRTFFASNENPFVMDSKDIGNVARFFSHSCEPNMVIQNVFVDTVDLRFPWVSFFTSKNVQAGDELTFDYGYEIGSAIGKVLYCHCGSYNCKKRIL